jgi:hypothetical protein
MDWKSVTEKIVQDDQNKCDGPRFRKPWMSEDYRMSIFDAVGLAVAEFTLKTKRNGSGDGARQALISPVSSESHLL